MEQHPSLGRKAIKAAGRNGSSLARDRRCLEKYDEYRSIKHINLPHSLRAQVWWEYVASKANPAKEEYGKK